MILLKKYLRCILYQNQLPEIQLYNVVVVIITIFLNFSTANISINNQHRFF